MTTMSFTDQLNHMWRTRPIRLPRSGPGAGVCAGIAYRYNVDVVLVRVAFVVSTIFGGAGGVLYLAGWLLFTQAGDRVSAAESLFGKGRASQSHRKTGLLIILLIVAVSSLAPINMGAHGSGLVSMALMLGGWWLLYQRTPLPPAPPDDSRWDWDEHQTDWAAPAFETTSEPAVAQAGTPPSEPPVAAPAADTEHEAGAPGVPPAEPVRAPAAGPVASDPPTSTLRAGADPAPGAKPVLAAEPSTPPSWDPLGVAPFAWDLPEPTPSAEPAPVPARP
ncbi:MAG: PspC domain-containing protein, partial [Streptomycetaceae bacterium]|nr:PspC domain-containing protein [Streptomycetaceae bacterium]